MSNWEKHIQQKLSDVEGQPSADAWDNIQHQLDHPFEASIQKKVGNIAAPSLSPELWTTISGSLSGSFESQIKEKVDTYADVPSVSIWENIDATMQDKGLFDEAVARKVRNTSTAPPANGWGYISRRLDSLIAAKRRRQIATWAAIFLCAIIPSSNLMRTWLGDDRGQLVYQNDVVNSIQEDASTSSHSGNGGANAISREDNSSFNDNSAEQFAVADSDNEKGNANENGDGYSISEDNHNANTHAIAHVPKHSSNLPLSGNQKNEKGGGEKGFEHELSGIGHSAGNLVVSIELLRTNSHDGLILEGFQPKWDLQRSLANPVSEALKRIKQNTQMVMFSMSSGGFQENYKASNELSDFAQFADSLDGPGWSTSAGASFGFSVTKKFLLTTGLNLTYATKQTNFSVKPISEPTTPSSSYKTVNFSNGPESLQQANNGRSVYGLVDGETTGTIMPGTDRVLHSHYTWVSIPVGVRFEQPIGKKFNVSAGLGVEGQLLLNAHTFVPTVDKYGFTEIDPTFANEFYRPNLNGLSSLGINYSFSDAFSVELGVYHNRAISSISSGKDYISPMPFQNGIRLSAIQRL